MLKEDTHSEATAPMPAQEQGEETPPHQERNVVDIENGTERQESNEVEQLSDMIMTLVVDSEDNSSSSPSQSAQSDSNVPRQSTASSSPLMPTTSSGNVEHPVNTPDEEGEGQQVLDVSREIERDSEKSNKASCHKPHTPNKDSSDPEEMLPIEQTALAQAETAATHAETSSVFSLLYTQQSRQPPQKENYIQSLYPNLSDTNQKQQQEESLQQGQLQHEMGEPVVDDHEPMPRRELKFFCRNAKDQEPRTWGVPIMGGENDLITECEDVQTEVSEQGYQKTRQESQSESLVTVVPTTGILQPSQSGSSDISRAASAPLSLERSNTHRNGGLGAGAFSISQGRISRSSSAVLRPSDIDNLLVVVPGEDAGNIQEASNNDSSQAMNAQVLTREELRIEFENQWVPELVAVEAVREKEEPSPPIPQFKRYIILGVIVLLLVVAVIVGVLLGTGDGGVKDGNNDRVTLEPIEADTPSSRPTTFPTPAPTLSAERAELLDYLQSISTPSSRLALEENPLSPQYQAFLWLCSQGLFVPNSELRTKYALATLFYATDGENWKNQDGWLVDDDYCNWYTNSAAVCEGSGMRDLIELDLPANGLRGTIPEELSLLTVLESLRLPGNLLTGALSSALLKGMPKLRFLFLDGNTLTGTMPSEIGILTDLVDIRLVHSQLTGSLPSELGNLYRLRTFATEWCMFNGTLPSEIGGLTNLWEFDVRRAQFSGSIPSEVGNWKEISLFDMSDLRFITGSLPDNFYQMTRLTSLQLARSGVGGTISSFIGLLSDLRVLELGWNRLAGTLPTEIGLLTAVTSLSLFYNDELTGPLPTEIGNLGRLETLELRASNFTGPLPTEMGNMESLAYVIAEHNAYLDGTLPTELANLSNLKQLRFYHSGLSGTIPSEYSKMTQLRELNVAGNDMEGTFPSVVLGLSSLAVFGIGNQITGSIPSEIALMTALQELYLFENELSGSIPSQLGLLTSLQKLFVSGNHLSGMLPIELASLISLREFRAQQNALSETIPAELASWNELDIAYFDGNDFAGTMPNEFCAASSLYADCAMVYCPCCTYCCDDTGCEWKGEGSEPEEVATRESLPFRIFPNIPNPPR